MNQKTHDSCWRSEDDIGHHGEFASSSKLEYEGIGGRKVSERREERRVEESSRRNRERHR